MSLNLCLFLVLLKHKNAADLAFPVTGIIDEVTVQEGDHVDQGDMIISLERSSPRS